jgi:hypothetical protein
MAQKDLISFLKKLDSELTKSSKHYRQAQANKRAHIFRFNSGNFAKQVKIQAAAQDIPLSNDDRKFINTAAEELLTKLKRSLPRIKADEKKITSGKTFIRMTFTSSVKKKSQYGDPDSIYGKIYDTYRPHLKKCFTNIQNYLKEQEFTNEETGRAKHKALRTKSGKVREAPGREIQLGHIKGKSVIESLVRDAFEDVMGDESVFTETGDALKEPDIRKMMEDLGIDISLVKDAKIDTYTVQLEAAVDNRADGKMLKERKKTLQDQIKVAVNKLGGIENLSGSDTPKQKYIKKTRQEVLEPFKNLKNVKVSAKDLKIDDKSSSGKRNAKTKAVKASKSRKKAGMAAIPAALKARKAKAQSSASRPLQLIGVINKELPNTVRKNMKEPALVNRTGRFAESVRLTEVIQTPQGYPSFGYTYQRDPYQVFEEGSSGNWSNGKRDPRELIDKSIREIAAQFAIGRFYTRRV